MENFTVFTEFQLLGFSYNAERQRHFFPLVFLVYLTGILGNLVMITVIYIDVHLHRPMYFFLSNLSFIDICYTTVIVPKLMDILLMGKTIISSAQCYTQVYFYIFLGNTEIFLLLLMAYDRYLAICNPLQYHCIMGKRKCTLLLTVIWLNGCANSFLLTHLATQFDFCRTNTVPQFFCEVIALANIACTNTKFQTVLYVDTFITGICPLVLCIISYSKIITTIVYMHSTGGKTKTFSTCSAHLTVLVIFYGTSLSRYLKPLSENPDDLDKVLSVFYTAVVPMLNPLIYSLRNTEVQRALMAIAGVRKYTDAQM